MATIHITTATVEVFRYWEIKPMLINDHLYRQTFEGCRFFVLLITKKSLQSLSSKQYSSKQRR